MSETLIKRDDFGKVEAAMQSAGFSPEKVKQEISFALQLINKSPMLQKCSRESLQVAVLNISNIGLSLNPAAKEAYLVPRWNNVTKSYDASLEPGYVGLVKLLTDAGSVKSMTAQIVYEGDFFQYEPSDNVKPITHRPELNPSKRGEILGVYALATLTDGSRQAEFIVYNEVLEIRGRSETYKAYNEGKIKSCTWVTDEGEMSRKTVIKRIYKYLPRTERMQFIDKAIQEDNADFTASDAQVAYIESLLSTSTLEQRQRDAIEMELPVMGHTRASQVIGQLKENQQLDDKNFLRRIQSAPAS